MLVPEDGSKLAVPGDGSKLSSPGDGAARRPLDPLRPLKKVSVTQLQREYHREEPPGDYNTTFYCTINRRLVLVD